MLLAASTRLFSNAPQRPLSFWSPGFDDGPLSPCPSLPRRRRRHQLSYHLHFDLVTYHAAVSYFYLHRHGCCLRHRHRQHYHTTRHHTTVPTYRATALPFYLSFFCQRGCGFLLYSLFPATEVLLLLKKEDEIDQRTRPDQTIHGDSGINPPPPTNTRNNQ